MSLLHALPRLPVPAKNALTSGRSGPVRGRSARISSGDAATCCTRVVGILSAGRLARGLRPQRLLGDLGDDMSCTRLVRRHGASSRGVGRRQITDQDNMVRCTFLSIEQTRGRGHLTQDPGSARPRVHQGGGAPRFGAAARSSSTMGAALP